MNTRLLDLEQLVSEIKEFRPDKSKSDIITLGFDNDAYLQFKESILWNTESWRHSISRCQITKWAYLSDILPEKEDQ